MSYGLVTTVPPDAEPVSLSEAKAHLNVGHPADDDLIGALIAAAREQTEAETGRRWMPQTVVLSLSNFPWSDDGDDGCYGQIIRFPFEPVRAVNAVRYYDTAGVLQTLAPGDYLTWLTHSPPELYPVPQTFWPYTQIGRRGAVEIECDVGYANAGAVPATAKEAMKLAIGFWYEHRGDSDAPAEMGLPPAAIRLLRTLHTGLYS